MNKALCTVTTRVANSNVMLSLSTTRQDGARIRGRRMRWSGQHDFAAVSGMVTLRQAQGDTVTTGVANSHVMLSLSQHDLAAVSGMVTLRQAQGDTITAGVANSHVMLSLSQHDSAAGPPRE